MSRPRGKPNQRLDWGAIRGMYIEGRAENPDGDPNLRVWPSIDDVALAFSASPRTIAQRSSREGWVALREQHQDDVERARRDQLVRVRAGQIETIDHRGLSLADAGLSLIQQRIQFLVRLEIDQPAGERGRLVNASELAALGLAARRWVDVKDRVLGRGPAVGDDEAATLERDLRAAEQGLAERIARHRAAAVGLDDADLP